MDITIHRAHATVTVYHSEAEDLVYDSDPDEVELERQREAIAGQLEAGVDSVDIIDWSVDDYGDGSLTAKVELQLSIPKGNPRLSDADIISALDAKINETEFMHDLCTQAKRVTVTRQTDDSVTYDVVAGDELLNSTSLPTPALGVNAAA